MTNEQMAMFDKSVKGRGHNAMLLGTGHVIVLDRHRWVVVDPDGVVRSFFSSVQSAWEHVQAMEWMRNNEPWTGGKVPTEDRP